MEVESIMGKNGNFINYKIYIRERGNMFLVFKFLSVKRIGTLIGCVYKEIEVSVLLLLLFSIRLFFDSCVYLWVVCVRMVVLIFDLKV